VLRMTRPCFRDENLGFDEACIAGEEGTTRGRGQCPEQREPIPPGPPCFRDENLGFDEACIAGEEGTTRGRGPKPRAARANPARPTSLRSIELRLGEPVPQESYPYLVRYISPSEDCRDEALRA